MSLDRSKPIEFGSFSDTAFLGTRQSPSSQSGGGNLAGSDSSVSPVDVLMVPDFQGASGQGNNQSTNRPKGSV